MSKGKILVIRGGAIGDFILTLPAISALRQQFPEAHLEVLGYPHIAQLALAGGIVDRIQSIEAQALAGFFAKGGNLDPDLADYFSEFDVIVSYLYDPDFIFQTNVCLCTPAQFILGPHRPHESSALHASEVFLKPLERLAIFGADHIPRLSLGPRRTRKHRLALHPGSGSARKNWPEARWASLLERIVTETSWEIVLVGGEAEPDRVKRLSAALPPTRTLVSQSRPLVEVAATLEQCAVYVGHDSGISHLAGALGLPGLLLWGETNSDVWRPPSTRITLLRQSSGLVSISVEEVFRRLCSMFEKH